MNFIERLKAYIITNAGLDKWYHFLAGLGISLVGWILFSAPIGMALAILAGFAKELIWDKLLKKGSSEGRDFLWTATGVIPTAIAWTVSQFVLTV